MEIKDYPEWLSCTVWCAKSDSAKVWLASASHRLRRAIIGWCEVSYECPPLLRNKTSKGPIVRCLTRLSWAIILVVWGVENFFPLTSDQNQKSSNWWIPLLPNNQNQQRSNYRTTPENYREWLSGGVAMRRNDNQLESDRKFLVAAETVCMSHSFEDTIASTSSGGSQSVSRRGAFSLPALGTWEWSAPGRKQRGCKVISGYSLTGEKCPVRKQAGEKEKKKKQSKYEWTPTVPRKAVSLLPGRVYGSRSSDSAMSHLRCCTQGND